MSVNTGVVNKRAAVSAVYNVFYSINKVEEEARAYGGTGEPFLWHDSSEISRTREQHLQPRAQILWTAEMHTGDWRTTNSLCVSERYREWKWEKSEQESYRVIFSCLHKNLFNNAWEYCEQLPRRHYLVAKVFWIIFVCCQNISSQRNKGCAIYRIRLTCASRVSTVKPVPWLAVNLYHLFSDGAAVNTQSHSSLTS